MTDRLRYGGEVPSGCTFPRGFRDIVSIQWPLVPAREIFELRYGRALVEGERRAGTIPVYGTNGRCGSHDTALFPGPGVILGRKGQGPLGVEWSEGGYWVIDTAYSLVPRRPDVDLKYAYFLVKFIGLNHLKDGTSNPSLSRDTFGAQALPLPPLTEQRAIARILGTLDDKIELNRRMNETLEAMARALFKSWFVDLDPISAKAEGRQPEGMSPAIAALFPGTFEDSPLGPIPTEWNPGRLGDIANNPRRGVAPGQVAPDTPYIGLEHMPRRSISLADWGRAGDTVSNKFAFLEGEILFGKLRPYFHKVGVAVLDGVCSTDVLVLRPAAPHWYGLIVAHASSESFVNYADRGSSGTRMPRTNWADMARYEIVIPTDQVADAFSQQVGGFVQVIRSSIVQSHTLAAIRDTLLPKLLSGQIRVREAEKLVEATV